MEKKVEMSQEQIDYVNYREAIITNPLLSEESKKNMLIEMEENFSSLKKNGVLPRTNSSDSSSPNSPTSLRNTNNTNSAIISSAPTISTTPKPIQVDRSTSPNRNRSGSIKGLFLAVNKFTHKSDESDDSKESPNTLRMSSSGNSVVLIENENKRIAREQCFFESVPIDKQLIAQILVKTKSTLNKKDGKIERLEGFDSNQVLMVIPVENMKDKTLILIDKKQIEGKGAYTTVVKGFDLINRRVLAVKMFSNLSKTEVKLLKQTEIKNLKTIGWFFNFCQLDKNEHSLIMKHIDGKTLLGALYVLNENLSVDNIWANYCTQKRELSFNVKFDLILKTMEQLVKLHNKHKLLHRDLKPANIKVSMEANGKVKKVRIVDFGSAIPIENSVKDKTIKGTDPYIHPALWYLKNVEELGFDKAVENLAGNGIYADIYALGVLFSEILTKKGENSSKNSKQQKMPKIQELMAKAIREGDLNFSSKENLNQVLEQYFLAGIVDEILNVEKNFQQFIRIERRKASDGKPIILTTEIQEFLSDVSNLEILKIKEEKKYETYSDFRKCQQNCIIFELKLLANKMLAIQSEDNCQSFLSDEMQRLKIMKENYEVTAKKVKQLLGAPTDLEAAINNMKEPYNGGSFFPKEKYKIDKNTSKKFKMAHLTLVKAAIEKFEEVHTRQIEKSEFEFKQTI